MGRKLGTRLKTSVYTWLATMKVGERRYEEVELEDYAKKQRHFAAARSRRPAYLKEFEFATQLFTAVSSSKAGDVRYLVCVERVK